LKTIPRKIDAILITGTGSDDVRRRANSLGAAYMEKPVQLRELETAIQRQQKDSPGKEVLGFSGSPPFIAALTMTDQKVQGECPGVAAQRGCG
jgi:DNA-binding response OmpR family regulator